VWAQSDANGYNIWSNRYVTGSGWGTAELIETNTRYIENLNPQVAVDAGGNSIAVWSQSQSDGYCQNIWSNRYVAGSGWGTPELIQTDTSKWAENPEVAVDDVGNAVAVWKQSETGFPSSEFTIWSNRYVAGSGWGTAELIGMVTGLAADWPQVAVDVGGNAIAVWEEFDGNNLNIYSGRYVAGTGWGTIEPIETANGVARFPQVAVDGGGNAVAVWTQLEGGSFSIWSNRYVAGAGWGTAELIEIDNVGDAEPPQVAVDVGGNAVAVWRQDDGTRENIWSNRYVAGVGWGMPKLLERDNTGSAGWPHVAVGGGNAVAVWQQSDGTRDNIWSNRYVK
jgi:hypothetical protein